eukprot:CAMPEP_0204847044 /NCGR_PEP_ID=MMETSP1347-20130617/2444_1 /ASSEMBLY_ACC=CAM_ASM_000690 /TAXON_ID=215587 /ORGANISM="Aplanochytrium stocchinoi, Strain GSBS06" /LENGTH=204 /DNA_ID=CAMNT_0051987847 /DNA_START=28 /DNA_END=639 /DNA_ORIENTATION=-
MALPTTQTGVEYSIPRKQGKSESAVRDSVQIELFLDYVCPFSSKMFLTLEKIWPKLTSDKDASFVFHQIPQTWHPQGSYCHEAALVVRELGTVSQYFDFSKLLFTDQKKYFDDATWNKSRAQIYDELSALAEKVGIEKEDFLCNLRPNKSLKDTGFLNYGNAITNELKFAVKFHRKRGVHVSPTVFLNGIEATQVSSGWAEAQW